MRDCSWSIVTTIWLQRPLPILSNNDVGSIWKGISRLLGPPLLRSLSDICLRPKKHEQKVRPRPYNLYIRLGPFRFLISKCGWAGKKKAWRLHARLDRNRTMSRDIWYLWPQVQKKPGRITTRMEGACCVVSHPCFNPIFVQFIGFVPSESLFAVEVAGSNFPWLYAAPSGTLRYYPP